MKRQIRVNRSRITFEEKISMKEQNTQNSYKISLDNFENFCMEKTGKIDYVSELQKGTEDDIYDFLQSWINYNKKLSARTVKGYFSMVKKYLHYRGIKLHDEDIKAELDFKNVIDEELYPLSLEDIQSIFKSTSYKMRVTLLCQLSGLMRIGELVQLRKKHLILNKQNIIVKIPASIAKFKKGRTTFLSKEASKMLRPILRRIDDNDLVFGSSENSFHAELNAGQTLRRVLIKIGLDMRYESTDRLYINTHSWRAYGITKISRHDENFAKKLAGQKGYLLQYDRMTDDEKLELYEKFEIDLIIDNTEKLKLENQKKAEQITELQAKNQEIENLMKVQTETTARLDEMSNILGTKLHSQLDENKEPSKKDLKLFAKIMRLKMNNDHEYSKEMKVFLKKRPGLPEELKKKISEL